jgi:hypothetical protein
MSDGNILANKGLRRVIHKRLDFIQAVHMEFQNFCLINAIADFPSIWLKDGSKLVFHEKSLFFIARRLYNVSHQENILRALDPKKKSEKKDHDSIKSMIKPFNIQPNSKFQQIIDYIITNLDMFWINANIRQTFDLKEDRPLTFEESNTYIRGVEETCSKSKWCQKNLQGSNKSTSQTIKFPLSTGNRKVVHNLTQCRQISWGSHQSWSNAQWKISISYSGICYGFC